MQQLFFTSAEDLTPEFSRCFKYLGITFFPPPERFSLSRGKNVTTALQLVLQLKLGQDYKENVMCYGNHSATLKLELKYFTAGIHRRQMHKTDFAGGQCASTNFFCQVLGFPCQLILQMCKFIEP